MPQRADPHAPTGLSLLSEFEIGIFVWDLDSDDIAWPLCTGPGPSVAGLADIRSGRAFDAMHPEAAARRGWAGRARPGDRRRFQFCVPAGPATVIWFEEELRRSDQDGRRAVTGLLRPIAAPRPTRARTDPLAVPQRARAELLGELLRAAPDSERAYTIFGIDNLRDLNRALGADVADEVLTAVEARIGSARPPAALYGRVASARFALAETGVSAPRVAASARHVMNVAAREPVTTSAGPVTVSLSAGICHVPAGAQLPADPFASASAALEEGRIGRIEALRFARLDGGGARLRDRLVASARLVMDALSEERVTLAFQPVMRAEQRDTPAFHECLARIVDRDGHEIAASAFMPAIAHLGLVRQVDRTVLAGALATLRDHPGLRLSVNVSPLSMQDSDWMELLEDGLHDAPDCGDRLILELTESSAIIDPIRTLDFMNRARKHGCAFALDDFGAGYTSFRHFRDFRFDAVKIDGSFIRGIAGNEDNQLLVRTLVSIADHFNMFTVAEFVEDRADADLLTGMGVDCLQGYHLGRPTRSPSWLADAEARRRA